MTWLTNKEAAEIKKLLNKHSTFMMLARLKPSFSSEVVRVGKQIDKLREKHRQLMEIRAFVPKWITKNEADKMNKLLNNHWNIMLRAQKDPSLSGKVQEANNKVKNLRKTLLQLMMFRRALGSTPR